ncbi:MAG: hypothetical protein COB08_005555 [Rhodobacteraceae bacterium]|nr:hypothetical protein [Paracoccaceae bacterium]
MAYQLVTVMPDMPSILEVDVSEISFNSCRKLWCEVIYQTWRGAFPEIYKYGRGESFSTNQRADMRRDQDWFGSWEFLNVCEYAGVNAENILAQFRLCMSDPEKFKGLNNATN